MDLLPQALLALLCTLLPLLIFIFFHRSKKMTRCSLPEADGAWPIIGHMHLFRGKQLTHKTLAAMADKYGPAFSMTLGVNKVLVVSNWEMAKECFTVHDKAFSDRPTVTASKLLAYDCAMFGFAPYGSYWREMRKIATIELLSNYRLDLLKHIRASEVESAIKEVYKRSGSGSVVDMKQWFGHLTHNIALRMVGGKRCFGPNADVEQGEALRVERITREFARMFGLFMLSDAMPYLAWLDFRGYKKLMERTAQELDDVVQGWLEDHKHKRLLHGNDQEERDFMDVLLNKLGQEKPPGFDSDTIIKATCLNLIFAGSDTTMVTLTWALSLLINSPHVLQKAQDELDRHVGRERHVEESDIKNLVYLQAIIKETMRLYPASPIIGLRSSMEDCSLSPGHHIESGTRLMVNLYKVHRDESVWPNANEFEPERFLTSHKDVDVRGKSFLLMPFGYGRRACPGASLALQVVHLALASLLHNFQVVNPSNEPVDMTESIGLTMLKASPLEVMLVPRLASGLYAD